MSYIVVVPEVSSVSFSANPVSINQSFRIEAIVTEIQVELLPEIFYLGEINSGEV